MDNHDEDDGLNAFRGLVNGVLLSIPLWAVIYFAVRIALS